MLFSFVLPAYKSKYLALSIESILSQTYKEFELIIVNDASPEDLDSIVNSFHDIRIRYYKNQQNIGGKDLIKQWNHCLTYAKGEYIILASDDDLYAPDFLSTFIPLIEKYPKVYVFRARCLDIDNNGNICGTDDHYKEYISPNEYKYLWFCSKFKWCIANYIFNKNILLNKGGFINLPLGWGSDETTVLMMAENGLVTSNEYLFMFRYSGINISSNNNDNYLRYKLKARISECYWREKNKYIQINNPLDQYYQDTIIFRQKGYLYNSIFHLIDKMNFKTFILSIRDILSFDLLEKERQRLIIVNILTKFLKKPFNYIGGYTCHIIKQIRKI